MEVRNRFVDHIRQSSRLSTRTWEHLGTPGNTGDDLLQISPTVLSRRVTPPMTPEVTADSPPVKHGRADVVRNYSRYPVLLTGEAFVSDRE